MRGCRHLGRAGNPNQPHGQDDGQLRPGTVNGRAYPMRATVPRRSKATEYKGEATRAELVPQSAASSARCWVARKARLSASSLWRRRHIAATEGRKSSCRRERCCASAFGRAADVRTLAEERGRRYCGLALLPHFFHTNSARWQSSSDRRSGARPTENMLQNCEGGG